MSAVQFILALEEATTSGARALIYAAEDELDRRYGVGADTSGLTEDAMVPPQGFFITARHDGQLAGGVGLRRGKSDHVVGEVKRLWVRPDLRRSGLAALLMARLEEEATTLGLRHLFLETGGRQPEAASFYVKTGWQRVTRFPDGSSGHPHGRIFEKKISDSRAGGLATASDQIDHPATGQ